MSGLLLGAPLVVVPVGVAVVLHGVALVLAAPVVLLGLSALVQAMIGTVG